MTAQPRWLDDAEQRAWRRLAAVILKLPSELEGQWTAQAAHSRVRDGADPFVIENGWIVAQTIHYTVEPRPLHSALTVPQPGGA